MQKASPRNVLVIAYYFPPMGLSGVQRTLKFVKYLTRFGWQPTVLTVTSTGYYAQDYTLLEELNPSHVEIVRVGSLDPNRLFRRKGVVRMPSERWRRILTYLSDLFFIPDNKIGWKHKAVKAAEELFEKKKFEIIFATAPPFTDFLIGNELSVKFSIPLVIDYRDSWHANPLKYFPTPLHSWRNHLLEKHVLRAASKIITTNRRVKELILKRYKFLNYNDITILSQGYDPDDFSNVTALPRKPTTMRITYAGVFYGDRSPRYFLEAVREFIDEHTPRPSIEVCFIGNFHDEHMTIVKELHLEEFIVTTGYLDHAHCVQYLVSSDVLWFMLENDTQSPGKLYEYLGARKPILACVPDGFVRQTVEEAQACIVTPPDDVPAIAKAITELYDLFLQHKLPQPKEEVVAKYNRVDIADELSKLFGFLVE